MKNPIFSLAFLFIGCLSFSLSADTAYLQDNIRYIDCVLVPQATRKAGPLKKTQHAANSTNWAGYAVETNFSRPTTNSVDYVSGNWNVPTLSASSPSAQGYCAIWVGIDGYSSNTVQQIGTESDWNVENNTQFDYAWIELYPDYTYILATDEPNNNQGLFPVAAGDAIGAAVYAYGGGAYALLIINYTQQVGTNIPISAGAVAYAQNVTKQNSAEWIVEAPYENGILPLAQFTTIQFTNCFATMNINNQLYSGPIDNTAHWQNQAITMVNQTCNRRRQCTVTSTKATPSALTDGPLAGDYIDYTQALFTPPAIPAPTSVSSFTVTWGHQ